MPAARKIIYLITEDWCFLTHRFDLAVSMRQAGWDVVVAAQVNSAADRARIEAAGLRMFHLPLHRARLVAFGDVLYWWRIWRLYRRERPDLVHHVAMKPVLYGSLAALFVPGLVVVNAVAGLGFLFSSPSRAVKLVRGLVVAAFRRLFARPRTCLILQNREDFAFFAQLGIPPDKMRLIRGAGVDTTRFVPTAHGQRVPPVAVLAARMLKDKGIPELVQASRLLKQKKIPLRVLLAGGVDEENPNSLTAAELRAFEAEGLVEWLGHQSDMAAIYGAADIAVLPTNYREGVPKTLLEGAACALPIVGSDSAGCREIVQEGHNGFLVPLRDPVTLAAALERLALDPDLRRRMGAASRDIALREFTHTMVIAQTQQLYQELLAGK